MTIAVTQTTVTWATSTATQVASVGAAGNVTSDSMTLSGTNIALSAQIKADHASTPASGNTLDVYALYSLGAVGTATADLYGTAGHGVFLARLDTFTEDPCNTTVALNPNAKYVKFYAVNNGATAAISVAVSIQEKTA